MILTLLFFLKPHYRKTTGWQPTTLYGKERKKKKKKIYRIEGDGNRLQAVAVDYSDFATSLEQEIKRKRKRKNETLILIQYMLEDD